MLSYVTHYQPFLRYAHKTQSKADPENTNRHRSVEAFCGEDRQSVTLFVNEFVHDLDITLCTSVDIIIETADYCCFLCVCHPVYYKQVSLFELSTMRHFSQVFHLRCKVLICVHNIKLTGTDTYIKSFSPC